MTPDEIDKMIDNTGLSRQERDGLRIGIKDYVDMRISDLQRAIDKQDAINEKVTDRRFNESEKATDIALASQNKRFETTNEWRQSLDDFVKGLVTKAEFETWKESVNKDIRAFGEFKAEIKAKASQSQVNISIALSILAMASAIILKLIK